jgi:hypothetical protein
MTDAPDNREIFIWRRRDDDMDRLVAVIAAKAVTELFNLDGCLVRLQDGQFIMVGKEAMRAIVTRHIQSLHLVNRGTSDEPKWEAEYFSFEFPVTGSTYDLNRGPNEKTLINLIEAIVPLVAKAPGQPVELKPQQLQEIQARLRSGEPAPQIAASYRVEVDAIRELARVR